MRKYIILCAVILTLLISGCSSNTENVDTENTDDTIKFRVGMGNSEDHQHYAGLEKMIEVLEEESGGKFDVEIFANATLGDDREMMEGLQAGTLDATLPAVGVVSNFVTEFEIFNFPFLIPDHETVDNLIESPEIEDLLNKFEETGQGMVGMDIWEQGFLQLTSSKHEINSIEDMKGLKIRAMENDIQLDTLKHLGANPTPMAYSELFTALQQGAVDGQQNPISNIYSDKLYEVQDNVTMTNHHYGPSIFLVSEQFLDKLSDEEREILENAIFEGNKKAKEVSREQESEQIEKIKEAGLKVIDLDEKEIEKMEEEVQPLIDKYRKELGEEFVDDFYQAVEDASK